MKNQEKKEEKKDFCDTCEFYESTLTHGSLLS